jgi:hypothetical protein
VLTGSLHTRSLIHSSLETRTCDLVGIGRPSCIKPALPRQIVFNADIPDHEAVFGGYTIPGGKAARSFLGGGGGPADSPVPAVASYAETEDSSQATSPLAKGPKPKAKGIPLVGAGVSTFWHEWQMCRMGRGLEPDIHMTWWAGAFWEGVVWAILGAILKLFKR